MKYDWREIKIKVTNQIKGKKLKFRETETKLAIGLSCLIAFLL